MGQQERPGDQVGSLLLSKDAPQSQCMAVLTRPESRAAQTRSRSNVQGVENLRATVQVQRSLLGPQRTDAGRVFREEITEFERSAIDVGCVGQGAATARAAAKDECANQRDT